MIRLAAEQGTVVAILFHVQCVPLRRVRRPRCACSCAPCRRPAGRGAQAAWWLGRGQPIVPIRTGGDGRWPAQQWGFLLEPRTLNAMLWLALYFPQLPLEVFTGRQQAGAGGRRHVRRTRTGQSLQWGGAGLRDPAGPDVAGGTGACVPPGGAATRSRPRAACARRDGVLGLPVQSADHVRAIAAVARGRCQSAPVRRPAEVAGDGPARARPDRYSAAACPAPTVTAARTAGAQPAGRRVSTTDCARPSRRCRWPA